MAAGVPLATRFVLVRLLTVAAARKVKTSELSLADHDQIMHRRFS
jgi:hypothetical protein